MTLQLAFDEEKTASVSRKGGMIFFRGLLSPERRRRAEDLCECEAV